MTAALATLPVAPDPMADAPIIENWPASRRCFMGFDPSLTAFGVAVMARGRMKTFILKPPKGQDRGVERLVWFRHELVSIMQRYSPIMAVAEGYSYGSQNSHSHSLGELGAVLRIAAYDCRLPLGIAAPSVVKKFATGKGNSPKGVVIKEFYKRWGLDVEDDNEADAGVMSLMAHASFCALDNLTAFQQTAVKEVAR